MNAYPHILLNRLRSKSRIGQTAGDENTRMQDMLDELKRTMPGLTDIMTHYNTAMANLSDTQYDVSMGLGKVIGMHEVFNKKIESLTANLTWLEEHNSALNKSYGISSGAAQDFAESLREVGIAIGYGDDKMQQYAEDLKGITSGFLISDKMNANMKKNMLQFQAFAQGNLGLTAEAASGFEMYARDIGVSGNDAAMSLETFASKISTKTGLDSLQVQRDIMEEIGGLSEDLRLQYSRIPGSLEVAVLKAKALGVTMEQLNRAGEELMNIESSVGNEIEYQLLTGKRLLVDGNKSLTNEYRMAQLKGDANKQAELMNSFLEDQGDVLRTNYMARKKAAELFGMDANAMSKMLEKQALATKLGAKSLMTLQGDSFNKEINNLRQQYAGDKEKLADIDKLVQSQDTRTSHEKVVEDNLATIARTIGVIGGTKVGGNRQIDVGEMRKELPGQKGLIAKSFDQFKTQFDNQAELIGKITKSKEVMDVFTKSLKEISAKIPVLGETMDQLDAALTSFAGIELQSGTTPKVAAANDALIIPDKGPIIRPNKRDVIAAFRPNDVIENTLKGSTANNMAAAASHTSKLMQSNNIQNKVSNYTTTTPDTLSKVANMLQTMMSKQSNVNVSIDGKALANEIANAMKSVKVEATVKTDNLFAATRMNSEKRFS